LCVCVIVCRCVCVGGGGGGWVCAYVHGTRRCTITGKEMHAHTHKPTHRAPAAWPKQHNNKKSSSYIYLYIYIYAQSDVGAVVEVKNAHNRIYATPKNPHRRTHQETPQTMTTNQIPQNVQSDVGAVVEVDDAPLLVHDRHGRDVPVCMCVCVCVRVCELLRQLRDTPASLSLSLSLHLSCRAV
jgi:hypothetical protein